MHFKICGKLRPFCRGLNVLTIHLTRHFYSYCLSWKASVWTPSQEYPLPRWHFRVCELPINSYKFWVARLSQVNTTSFSSKPWRGHCHYHMFCSSCIELWCCIELNSIPTIRLRWRFRNIIYTTTGFISWVISVCTNSKRYDTHPSPN